MPSFPSYDGTMLSYRAFGNGPTLVCIPGGPARDSVYFGDLGGLEAHRTLVILDNRGSGGSADASDVDSYRVDRLVDDVEALRQHLGLEQMNLLGHSGGAQIATLYAAKHPSRLSSLVLVTGGQRITGSYEEDAFLEGIAMRVDEPGYGEARAALDEWIAATGPVSPAIRRAAAMLFYGRPWTSVHAQHADDDEAQRRNQVAMANFFFEPDVAEVRAGLAKVTAPVLVYNGEVDPQQRPSEAANLAALFQNGTVVTQPDAGHFPWLDNPSFFVTTVAAHPAS